MCIDDIIHDNIIKDNIEEFKENIKNNNIDVKTYTIYGDLCITLAAFFDSVFIYEYIMKQYADDIEPIKRSLRAAALAGAEEVMDIAFENYNFNDDFYKELLSIAYNENKTDMFIYICTYRNYDITKLKTHPTMFINQIAFE